MVRPIIQLLAIDRTALENYEALLALTNLGGASDSIRYVTSAKGAFEIITLIIVLTNIIVLTF